MVQSGHKSEDITLSIPWRREAWKEEVPNDLLWKDEREPSSVKGTLELFQRRCWGNFWETEWAFPSTQIPSWTELKLTWTEQNGIHANRMTLGELCRNQTQIQNSWQSTEYSFIVTNWQSCFKKKRKKKGGGQKRRTKQQINRKKTERSKQLQLTDHKLVQKITDAQHMINPRLICKYVYFLHCLG